MPDSSVQLKQLLNDSIVSQSIRHIVLSSPRRKDQEIRRIDVRPVRIKAGLRYQLASRSKTQEFHENLDPADTVSRILKLASDSFQEVRVVTNTAVWEGRSSGSGHYTLKANKSGPSLSNPPVSGTVSESNPDNSALDHNRRRAYLIPEGQPCPFLIRTGIMSSSGQVLAKHFHKFRQINRYLEFIRDIVGSLPESEPIGIVDFGCGKSYLTFAAHYLFSTVLKRDFRITGLDQRPDVINTCREITADLGLSDLQFERGQIAGYNPQHPVHLAISLHACNTATDDAIYQAVQWKSPVIMAVPCCQHELAEQLTPKVAPLFTTSGIVREQFASLATDSIRAALLRAIGYDADIMEFIETEHTPKNLLIRAIRRTGRSDDRRPELEHVMQIRTELNARPLRLERLLREGGFLPQ